MSQVQAQVDVGQQLGQYGPGVHQVSHKRVSPQAGERRNRGRNLLLRDRGIRGGTVGLGLGDKKALGTVFVLSLEIYYAAAERENEISRKPAKANYSHIIALAHSLVLVARCAENTRSRSPVIIVFIPKDNRESTRESKNSKFILRAPTSLYFLTFELENALGDMIEHARTHTQCNSFIIQLISIFFLFKSQEGIIY